VKIWRKKYECPAHLFEKKDLTPNDVRFYYLKFVLNCTDATRFSSELTPKTGRGYMFSTPVLETRL
jgi:hypothetical protein